MDDKRSHAESRIKSANIDQPFIPIVINFNLRVLEALLILTISILDLIFVVIQSSLLNLLNPVAN